ncbi:endonuclease/exonuclease/phosphatase family protein [Stieleria sp. ICT_E10.1]|uniref:endonuclease/exonuclease/phosphatase family protein n=1 Tax=Stieleria sedimenti TaxID=2976331 RepID=UPI0021807B24|nr:endonuclease/exonuclease/phosphatase family protein [Stieleria sedimenti]MCS7467274.1 endonuclease/exonuclease/phosphatase family protein [Stieleria sedimenti]
MYRKTTLIRMTLALSIATFLVPEVTAQTSSTETPMTETLRIATFNASLYGKRQGQIRERLSDRDDLQAKRIASIIQTIRPDVLLINELDHEPDAAPARLLAENYFAVPQNNADGEGKLSPVVFPFFYSAPSNTGIDSTLDLNNDGQLGSGNDAWGYGIYPGQYSMTVYSRFPIDTASIRSFQKLRWKDLPGAIRPVEPATGQPYYDDATWSELRLSSKNHIDVPIQIGDRVLHVLASHPTPPVFDGPEDRNGARNHDEIEFWNHYLSDDDSANTWLIDDAGRAGPLDADASFVVMGDLNADPIDGSGRREAILRLLNHPRTRDVQQGKTADFGRNGLMRVDFVLPSKDLNVIDSGVFWPTGAGPQSTWIKASDHRLVWIDVKR